MGWDLTGRLTARLLQHYATHEPFKRGLAELYARHCAPRLDDISRARDLWQLEVPERTGEGLQDWVVEYLENLEELAAAFRLDFLTKPVSMPASLACRSAGALMIHRWCNHEAGFGRMDSDLRTDTFVMVGAFSGPAPEMDHEDEPATSPVTTVISWNPRAETRSEARERISRAITVEVDSALDEIADRAEENRYGFNPPRHAERDVLWLFWRLTEGLSYAQIVVRWNLSDDNPESSRNAVRAALPAMATRLGVDRDRLSRIR